MLQNYFKIAFRNLLKNKGFSAINILGLAIGITTFLLIALYVIDELSYDSYHEKGDRIYRVNSDIKFGGKEQKLAVNSDPMAATLKRDYPIVEDAVRFRDQGSYLVKRAGTVQNFTEQRLTFADNSLFNIFTIPLLRGNKATALTEPNTIVVSESIARKYFKSIDVLGQVLILDNNQDYRITGVFRDMPENSHFIRDFFISMEGLQESKQGNFLSHNFVTYVLLKPGADPAQLDSKFDEVMERYMGPQAKKVLNADLATLKEQGNYVKYSLMPMKDIHLHSNRVAELAANNDIQYVYIFSAIAIVVLLIACTNFMNLSTARSAGRAREVGIRKVLGSKRSNLIKQFLAESTLLSFAAFVIALLAAMLLLPYFNQLANKNIELNVKYFLYAIPALLLLVILTGLVAGSYPAFYLSAFKPIQVLKGKSAGSMKSGWLRSGLVVLQFALSTILIIGTIVIYRQLNFIQNKALGFQKEQLLSIQDTYILGDFRKVKTFKDEVLKHKEFKSGTISSFLPVPSSRNDEVIFPEGTMEQDKAISTQIWAVDNDYLQTMGMQLVKGRNFDSKLQTDSSAVVINESFARLLGYKEPINKKISRFRNFNSQELIGYTIIGVVKDFHFESLRTNIVPACLILSPSTGRTTFRITTGDLKGSIAAAQAVWSKMAPGQPFNYSFVDEDFDSVYRAEQRTGSLLAIFASLAIFVACLGLFGLAAYAAEQRTKEIGIRKVLGATVSNVIGMLSKDFLRLVVIAFLISVPVAWWIMHSWLQDFAFRVNMAWWIFALAGFIAGCIALATVSMQAIKAALANPVNSLRNE